MYKLLCVKKDQSVLRHSVCVCTHVYVCIYIYIYKCVCVHTHTHTHTHRVELSYNDLGFRHTSIIALCILWYCLIPH